jgi:hypothetical protein
VNQAETAGELAALRTSLARGRPLGTPAWTAATAARLGLTNTLRPRGRPKKQTPSKRINVLIPFSTSATRPPLLPTLPVHAQIIVGPNRGFGRTSGNAIRWTLR